MKCVCLVVFCSVVFAETPVHRSCDALLWQGAGAWHGGVKKRIFLDLPLTLAYLLSCEQSPIYVFVKGTQGSVV